MDTEVLTILHGEKRRQWLKLLADNGLHADLDPEQIVLIWDGDTLAATGARDGYLLKYIAVNHHYQGEDLTATVLTALRREAFAVGHQHLLLYTKPQNEAIFSSLLFHTIVSTSDALLMENVRDGIDKFLGETHQVNASETVAAIVMNCDPFTLGHRHLIETAAGECDRVMVFVLSEDKGYFSADDRLEMVRLGTADLPNVTVSPTGPYLISSATFPTYFLKDRDNAADVHCAVDIEVFVQYFTRQFGITHRYVGEEPLSVLTAKYNEALKRTLPAHDITVKEVARLEKDGQPISASSVRRYLQESNLSAVRPLVPDTTFTFITGGN